ncbi:MAG: hypothetical protein KU37_08255 [Sulfuricurvum sp. PC08-66]|nr:MAG: hypothetical protein KU37_08255 [Sulfuricurvum sp. PC08-66]
MRRSIALLTLFFTSFLWANVEILSGTIEANATTIIARDDVLVLMDNTLMSASYVMYDKANNTLRLEGNVTMLQGAFMYILGEEIVLDTVNQINTFAPFFLQDRTTFTWLASSKAQWSSQSYQLQEAVISTCSASDPDWRMAFSSGTYYPQLQWVNIWNMRLYAGDIPVFYLPWIGFPTDFSRHSGLLAPSMGFSEIDGMYLEESYFWAINKRSDLEVKYQLRTERGNGAFAQYRFVDSPTSVGSVAVGIFNDFDAYIAKLNLKNALHYGVELDYSRKHVWDDSMQEGEDSLFADINLVNDIDYVALKANQALQTSTISTSRLNYAWSSDAHYAGAYGKFFMDTSKTDNSDTLQELPKSQYHKFIDSILWENIIYSVDVKNTLRLRSKYANAIQTAVEAPVLLTVPLFNDYLYFQAKEGISIANTSFTGLGDYNATQKATFDDGNLVQMASTFTLGTDLVKPLDNHWLHSLQLNGSITLPTVDLRTGFYTNSNNEFTTSGCSVGEPCEFVQGDIADTVDTYRFGLTQYLFDAQGEERFYQSLAQTITKTDSFNFTTTENEMRWRPMTQLALQNLLYYSVPNARLEKMVSSLAFSGETLSANITHYYQNQPSIEKISNAITFAGSWNFLPLYSLKSNYAFDFITQTSQNWSLGIAMRKRCWGYELSYSERVTPISTDAGASSYTDRYIYVKIELIPLGGFDFRQSLEQSIGS